MTDRTAARFSDEIEFCWATGIEDTFIPQVRPGYRALDEYALTQHYDQWENDLALAQATGAQAMRWGIPWYKVQPAPDRWDWDWPDRVLDRMVNRHGIIPIVDLMHYGTPLWLDNSFLHADYPERVAEYSARAAERYGALTRYFTPLNEPMVNAEWCGLKGEWPPYLTGEDGLVKLTLQLARGMVLATHALREAAPHALLVQVEALFHIETEDSDLEELAAFENERVFLAWDLATGRVGSEHLLAPWLQRWRISDEKLAWFRRRPVAFDIIGVNYYPWSWQRLAQTRTGQLQRLGPAPDGRTLHRVLQRVHRRYGIPIMVTETSALYDLAGRARWMDETVDAVCTARAEGVPVVGYTWFPMTTMFDWLYRRGRKPLEHYAVKLGLYDSHFDRAGRFVHQQTPLVTQFARHAAGTPQAPGVV